MMTMARSTIPMMLTKEHLEAEVDHGETIPRREAIAAESMTYLVEAREVTEAEVAECAVVNEDSEAEEMLREEAIAAVSMEEMKRIQMLLKILMPKVSLTEEITEDEVALPEAQEELEVEVNRITVAEELVNIANKEEAEGVKQTKMKLNISQTVKKKKKVVKRN